MGSDYLPPGVSERDIPGNRPIDLYAEQVWDKMPEAVWESYDAASTSDIALMVDEVVQESFDNNLSHEEAAKQIKKRYAELLKAKWKELAEILGFTPKLDGLISALTGVVSIDVIALNDRLNVPESMSLSEYLKQEYGEKAEQLARELL